MFKPLVVPGNWALMCLILAPGRKPASGVGLRGKWRGEIQKFVNGAPA